MLHVNYFYTAKKAILATLASSLLILVVCLPYANAQENISVRKGNYEVFHSMFNSSFLQPDTAVAIGVDRAKDIALLNLSIKEHLADGTSVARKATQISGSAFNLLHTNELDFQEIVEPGAVYYLAKIKISNDNEMIVIKASIIPEGSEQAIDLEFKHHFYLN